MRATNAELRISLRRVERQRDRALNAIVKLSTVLAASRAEVEVWRRAAAAREAEHRPPQPITRIAPEAAIDDYRKLSRFLTASSPLDRKRRRESADVRARLTTWWVLQRGVREEDLVALPVATFIRRFWASALALGPRTPDRLEFRLTQLEKQENTHEVCKAEVCKAEEKPNLNERARLSDATQVFGADGARADDDARGVGWGAPERC